MGLSECGRFHGKVYFRSISSLKGFGMARGEPRSVTKLSEQFLTHDELISQRAHNRKFAQRRIKTN